MANSSHTLHQNDHTAHRLSTTEFEDAVLYFSSSIMAGETEEDVLWDLAGNVISNLGYEDCVIYLLRLPENHLEQVAAFGPKGSTDLTINEPLIIPVGLGVTGRVAQTGQGVVVNDTRREASYIADDQVRLSELCVPIRLGDQVLGVIDSEHSRKGFYTNQDLRLLSAVANICGARLGRIRAERERREKQQALLEVERQMAALKLKSFATQMSPHFVFNAMNAIQHFMVTNDRNSGLKYLALISRLLRYYLKNMEEDTIGLAEECATLEVYLQLQKLRFVDRFHHTLDQQALQQCQHCVIPRYLLLTMVENIIETGLSAMPTYFELHIRMELKPKEVVFHMNFTHQEPNQGEEAYTADYRQHFSDWQGQIDTLNMLQGYRIHYAESTVRDTGRKELRLNLPNLGT